MGCVASGYHFLAGKKKPSCFKAWPVSMQLSASTTCVSLPLPGTTLTARRLNPHVRAADSPQLNRNKDYSDLFRICGHGEVDVILRYLSPHLHLRLTLRRALLHAISPRFLHAATGNLERAPRIELGSTGWKPGTLPICQARIIQGRAIHGSQLVMVPANLVRLYV